MSRLAVGPVPRAVSGPAVGPLLRVNGLTASYGAVVGLDGVDLEIAPGELVGIAGESGAGKSTLLRCLAGDLEPRSGTVTRGAHMRVAMAWQHTALCGNLDVAQNLLLGKERTWRLPSAARQHERAARMLAELGLGEELGRTTDRVAQLPVAERQLLALARAAADRPELLLLDEPSAPLGAAESQLVEALVARLHARGTAVVVVSHDVEQLFRLTGRIVVLRKGRVAGEVDPVSGHPDDVVALGSGHGMESSAHHQLNRLHALSGRLAEADATSGPLVVLSALGAALGAERLALHVEAADQSLRLVCSVGLPPDLTDSWRVLPTGVAAGPVVRAARRGAPEVIGDVRMRAAWGDLQERLWELRIASSWSVPFVGGEDISGVITVFRRRIGSPTRSELDLATLYGGYAASALQRDHLVTELTSRNLVLETIRDMLETLSAPVSISDSLSTALAVLVHGLDAEAAAIFAASDTDSRRSGDGGEGPVCVARATSDGTRLEIDHLAGLAGEASDADAAAGQVRSVAVGADWPGLRAHVVAWPGPAAPDVLVLVRRQEQDSDEAVALIEDAAHSLRLAITRHRAQVAAQEAAALRRTQQLQHAFLARLSHELRTPLTAINGYADTMLQPDVDWDRDSRERFLTRIAGESQRLGRLVEDLLDHSAIEAGVFGLQQDWCRLELILDAARACLPGEHQANVQLDVPGELAPVWADHDRLEQVFVNLLDNAFRHNPVGTCVRVRVAESAGRVLIEVCDDGTGRVGDAVSEQGAMTRRANGRSGGAGLGLSIARAIVSSHGGEFEVQQRDPGLCFRISLPVEPDSTSPPPGESARDERKEVRHGG